MKRVKHEKITTKQKLEISKRMYIIFANSHWIMQFGHK